ncbi:MAG: LamG-like jellyroll fold domain-containing protein [Pseudomonadota bacterium]
MDGNLSLKVITGDVVVTGKSWTSQANFQSADRKNTDSFSSPGNVQLLSIKDGFEDNDVNTDRWGITSQTDGLVNSIRVEDKRLYVETNGNSSGQDVGVISRGYIKGDFTIDVDWGIALNTGGLFSRDLTANLPEAAGAYQLLAQLTGTNEAILDSRNLSLYVLSGAPSLSVQTNNESYRMEQIVHFTGTIQNLGGQPPDSTIACSVSIKKGNGLLVDTLHGRIIQLNPMEQMPLMLSWNTYGQPAGTYSYEVSADTTAGMLTAQGSFTITNQTPIMVPIPNLTVNEGEKIVFSPVVSDPDNNTLHVTYSGWMTADNYMTGPNDVGAHTVFVTVSDGVLSTGQEIQVTVNNLNSPPVLYIASNISVNEGETVRIAPIVADPDGDEVTITYSGWMTGPVYTTNYFDDGVHRVIVTASDGAYSVSRHADIVVANVNRPPVLSPIGNYHIQEGGALAIPLIAEDPDGDAVYFDYENLPAGSYVGDNDQTFYWTPEIGVSGIYPGILFRAIDTGSPPLSDYETVSITVEADNRPPEIEPISERTVNEGDRLEFVVTAVDPDGDLLTYSVSNLPPGAVFDAPSRRFSWKPGFDQAGTYPDIQFTVTDDGETPLSATATLQITVQDRLILQIIDNSDPGRFEKIGDWQTSNWSGGGEFYGSDYLHDKNTGKGSKQVLYRPAFSNGRYGVYLRYTSGTNRASNTVVDIHHAGGISAKTINQRVNGGNWILLGSYEFTGNGTEFVEIGTGGTDGYVIADAMAFILRSDDVPCLPYLVSYWNFDPSGEVIIDRAGDNTGWIYGAGEVPGKVDTCLSFDGDDRVVVADSENLRLVDEFTLCAWVKESLRGQYAKIVSRRDGNYFYFLGVDNGMPYAGVGDGVSYTLSSKATTLPLNEWHHLAAVYQADTDSLKIYYDGGLVETVEVKENLPNMEGVALSIGSDEGGTEMFFKGDIDELAVFNASLTDDEITELYLKGMANLGYCSDCPCGNGVVDPGEDCDGDTNCPSTCRYGKCHAATVISYLPGSRKDGTPILSERGHPENALGAPQGTDEVNFVTLGFGGSIVLGFDSQIVNRQGNDFRITETSYGQQTCASYPETAHVYASKDGITWEDLGTGCLDSEFDLGALDMANYVKVVDASNPGDFADGEDGFDVDGIEAFSCR